MSGRRTSDPTVGSAELAAGLHDVSAGLAIGIGLLKGSDESAGGARALGVAIDALEEALAGLRSLLSTLVDRGTPRHQPRDLSNSLQQEARIAGIALELELIGEEAWLAADQADLLHLVGREAIRNVKSHSGAASCRLTIDLSDCPFVLRARDWGAGLGPGAKLGGGIGKLRELAKTMGCELAIRSQPGLGTELLLTGRRCPLNLKKPTDRGAGESRLRSVVAEESPSSRRRVAARRPVAASGQQITQV